MNENFKKGVMPLWLKPICNIFTETAGFIERCRVSLYQNISLTLSLSLSLSVFFSLFLDISC